jgi:hypothetical protein
MMPLDVVYRYGVAPGDAEMRGLDAMRDVYGVRRISFDENARTVRVEYDGTRLKVDTVAALLRRAGLDLRDRVVLASAEMQ